MICKKCEAPKTVTLRKKDYYCDNCFMINTTHKFRACLGKSKVLTPNENVLICLSGGVGSTVLLDLVHHGITLDNTKKLRINPHFLHLFDDNGKDVAEAVLDECKKYSFDVYIVHVSEYVNNCYTKMPEMNCIPDIEENIKKEFLDILNNMPPTAATDFLLKVKHSLFKKFAELLKCTTIFTAETTNTLAINLLCNLASGRGSQVQHDVGFSDTRHDSVKILRPMKDISKEELEHYAAIKQLKALNNNLIKNNSLQAVICSFVSDLQENFPATVSTVCKTADKIGKYDEHKINKKKCFICESNLHIQTTKLSALEATNISRAVSYGNTHFKEALNKNKDLLKNLDDCISNNAIFPFINNYLCYGCSRMHSEMNHPDLLNAKMLNNS